jgi:hypothetical protein
MRSFCELYSSSLNSPEWMREGIHSTVSEGQVSAWVNRVS